MSKEEEEEYSIADLVQQYVACREYIKDQEEKDKLHLKPYKDALATLENYFGATLHESKLESLPTTFGTVYKSPIMSIKITDREKFLDYAIVHDRDLLQISGNKTALKPYKEKKLPYPPGIEVTELININVRAK